MSVKVVVAKRHKGVPYRIETELADLKQIDTLGKVMRAVEKFIDANLP